MTWGARVGIGLVRAYQVLFGGLMGGACRFEPSCSHYALEAIEVHGLARGAILAGRRLARCRPWGGSGFDPIPPKADESLNVSPQPWKSASS